MRYICFGLAAIVLLFTTSTSLAYTEFENTEEKNVIENVAESLLEKVARSEAKFLSTLEFVQNLNASYTNQRIKRILFLLENVLANNFYYEEQLSAQGEYREQNRMLLENLPHDKIVGIMSSISSKDDVLLIQKGEDCEEYFNEYFGQNIIECASYRYQNYNLHTKMTSFVGNSPLDFTAIGRGSYLYDSQNERLITWVSGMPRLPTLPVSTIKMNEIALGWEAIRNVIEPEDLGLGYEDEASIERGLGTEDVYLLIEEKELVIIPRIGAFNGEQAIRKVNLLNKELTPILVN